MPHELSHNDKMRLIGARGEAARILVWVRLEIGYLRETLRLTPEHHVRIRLAIGDRIVPLENIARRIEQEHEFPARKTKTKANE